MCWIQSVSPFPDGFFSSSFLHTWDCFSICIRFCWVRPAFSFVPGRPDWVETGQPPGGAAFGSVSPAEGPLGALRQSNSASISRSGGDGECLCHPEFVCVFEEMCCWFNQAFWPFFDWFRKHFLLGLLFCLLSYFCLCFLFFVFFFQVPIIPVVFSSYSNFYLRKEKQFKSGNCPQLFKLFWVKWQ